MDGLNAAYREVAEILGEHTEPWESVRLVETYRRYFKPEKVRVVLLAESHVYTTDDDRKISIPAVPELPGYPTEYAKFVYCVAYGERQLTGNALHPKRDGTPQFWKILYSCANRASCRDDFRPVLRQPDPRQRWRNKITVLKQLKAKGIWLVDTSIVALYRDGRKCPNMLAALQQSWRSYTRGVVATSAPEHVICIGKGVASQVEGDLQRYFPGRYTVVAQPNAFLSSAEHMANYQTYSRICCPAHDNHHGAPL